MKKILLINAFLILFLGFIPNSSFAQVNMSTASGTYPQNFNTLASSGTGITWTDNSTIPNWYCQRTGTGSVYDTNDGTVTTAGSFLFSFGSTSSSDRALGSYGTTIPGNFAHGVLLRNTSGATMTNIRVSWTLEQWRNSGTNNTHTIFFWYKTSSSTITTLNPAPESGNSTTNTANGWTAVTALNSNAPLNGLPITVLDGNAIANKVSKTDISIPSLSLANNSYIMLKWDDPDQASGDQSMAIDDVTIAWGSAACTTPTAYNVTGTGSFCTGGTGVAVGLANSETGVTYQLKNGATNVGTAVSGTTGSAITFDNQTTATTYTVVATRTTGGCTATMTGSAVVTINTLPTAYTVTGTGSFCTGGTGVAVGLSNSETGVTYQLKDGATNVGSAVSGTTGSAITFGNQTTVATYTVVATRTTGACTATMTGSAVITVNAAVTPSATIAADQTNPITTGSNVAFTATPTNGGTTPIYQWKKNGSNVGMNQATYTDATLANNDVVKCVMTSNAVCASPTIATSNDITISTCNCSPTCSDIPTAPDDYVGAISHSEGAMGFTHYCNNKGKLLLSVKPVTTGATINILPTAVHIKIGATPATLYTQWCGEPSTSANKCFMASATGNGLINRWWHIDDPTSPALTLSNKLEVGFYFKEAEFNALNTLLSNVMSANTALMLYQPRQSVSLLQYAAPSLILSSKVHILANTAANSSGTAAWKIMTLTNGTIQAIFQTSTTKNSGGIGKF